MGSEQYVEHFVSPLWKQGKHVEYFTETQEDVFLWLAGTVSGDVVEASTSQVQVQALTPPQDMPEYRIILVGEEDVTTFINKYFGRDFKQNYLSVNGLVIYSLVFKTNKGYIKFDLKRHQNITRDRRPKKRCPNCGCFPPEVDVIASQVGVSAPLLAATSPKV